MKSCGFFPPAQQLKRGLNAYSKIERNLIGGSMSIRIPISQPNYLPNRLVNQEKKRKEDTFLSLSAGGDKVSM